MIRVDPNPGESRLVYLARVLSRYMDEFEGGLIHFDGADCDGVCLADDIRDAVDLIPDQGPDLLELKKGLAHYDAAIAAHPDDEAGYLNAQYLIKAVRRLTR